MKITGSNQKSGKFYHKESRRKYDYDNRNAHTALVTALLNKISVFIARKIILLSYIKSLKIQINESLI